jgi:hypothetical protein
VRLSVPLLKLCLAECGFGRIDVVTPPELPPRWLDWWRSQCGVIAFRTSGTKSALGSGRSRRLLPSDVGRR